MNFGHESACIRHHILQCIYYSLVVEQILYSLIIDTFPKFCSFICINEVVNVEVNYGHKFCVWVCVYMNQQVNF